MKVICPTCGTEFAAEIPLHERSTWEAVSAILNTVCRFFHVDIDTLKSKSRKRQISHARDIAIYLIRTHTDMTLEAIGYLFNRKHSTIIYSYEKVKKDLERGSKTKLKIEFLTTKLDKY